MKTETKYFPTKITSLYFNNVEYELQNYKKRYCDWY